MTTGPDTKSPGVARPGTISRRRFIADTAKTASAFSLVGLAVAAYARQSRALPAQAIRPPGALAEDKFLAACTRCGLCVRDCPYGILKLARIGDDVALGTPYFTARTGPCEMCTDIPCVPHCPTGALDPTLKDINKARMGLAVMVDEANCIAFQGLRCEICFNACPLRNKAIRLDMQPNKRSGKHAIFAPTVSAEHCTGCGLCEKACIMEESPIKVLPFTLAKGRIGQHYHLGWEEKSKAGGSLYGAEPEHKFNLPEGMQYDLQGKGLIINPPTPDSVVPPAPGTGRSAIDTLNQGLKGVK